MSTLNEVRIAHYYQHFLHRPPSVDELSRWLGFLRAGGTEERICRDLADGYEFTLETKMLFWAAFHRQPSEAELTRCRARVFAGASVPEAVRDTAAA